MHAGRLHSLIASEIGDGVNYLENDMDMVPPACVPYLAPHLQQVAQYAAGSIKLHSSDMGMRPCSSPVCER